MAKVFQFLVAELCRFHVLRAKEDPKKLRYLFDDIPILFNLKNGLCFGGLRSNYIWIKTGCVQV
jgi:hypothetical protein